MGQTDLFSGWLTAQCRQGAADLVLGGRLRIGEGGQTGKSSTSGSHRRLSTVPLIGKCAPWITLMLYNVVTEMIKRIYVKQCLNSYMLKLNHPKGTWSHMENSIDYQSSLPVRKSYGTHNGEQIRHDKKSESEMGRPGDIGTEIFAAWPAWWIRHERNRDGICDHLQVLPLAQHTVDAMNTHKCRNHCLFSFKNGSSSSTGGREWLIWVLLEGKGTDAKKIREIAIWRSLHHRVVHKQLLECHEVWKRSHIEL